MVADARRAMDSLEGLQHHPIGTLRVRTPAGFTDHLAAALAPLLAAHPAFSLHVVVSDEAAGIDRDRIDLAITLSRPLRDSGLIRRHLADWHLVLVRHPATWPVAACHARPANSPGTIGFRCRLATIPPMCSRGRQVRSIASGSSRGS